MMRDYIRSLMQTAHETGAPVIRPLFYEFPNDRDCFDISDAYMFGPDILVAPICYKGAQSRRVYLPAGDTFTCAGSGEVFEGGRWIEAEAALDTIPIFLRGGKQEYLIHNV